MAFCMAAWTDYHRHPYESVKRSLSTRVSLLLSACGSVFAAQHLPDLETGLPVSRGAQA